MKLLVHEHTIEIEKSPVNEKEINISKCEFVFDEAITNEFIKKALFTLDKGNTYEVTITNNECDIPQEVLQQKGTITIGVVATLLSGNKYVKRYNPSPAHLGTGEGSLKQATNSEPITPTDKEQIEQMLTNINLSISKEGKITTISFTNTDGETQTEQLEDGMGLNYNWNGTFLGIKREDEQSYNYVNLKGDTGAPGQIKMLIVNELPSVGSGDTLYFVPKDDPEQQDLYDEFAWVNNDWERLGEKRIVIDLSDYYTKQEVNNLIPTNLSQLNEDTTHRVVSDTEKQTWNGKADTSDIPDLTDYVKNTDYATANKGGVIKPSAGLLVNSSNGNAYCEERTYQNYLSSGGTAFISKGTLENVITGKELVNKTYVDGLVGDIDTALDLINGEVVN